ncbi:RNase adapter RapZ [Faecalimonas sp.]
MRVVIVTGMSGAGKSTALKVLEDVGYFCVDNLPIPLLPKLAELLKIPRTEFNKIALGIDIRGGQDFLELEEMLKGIDCEIVFLDANDNVLVKRYKETRRTHPLTAQGSIGDGIYQEREILEPIKKKADYIIDTSLLLTRELKQALQKIFVDNQEYKNLYLTIVSFGFKYGIPNDADLVFDVRFLPNPYYIEELRPKTGNEKEVQEYVMSNGKADVFLQKLQEMIEFLIPNYITEGKHQLVIGIGCTGGKHRSVTLANALYNYFKEKNQYGVRIEHRDIEKDALRKV